MQELAGLLTEIIVVKPGKLRALSSRIINKIKFEKDQVGTYNPETNIYSINFDFIGTLWGAIFYKMYKHHSDDNDDDDYNKFDEIQILTCELLISKIKSIYDINTSLEYERD